MNKILLALAVLTLALRAQTVTVTASPATLAFTYQVGAATLPSAQTVTVKASSGTPAFTTAITPPGTLWLTVTPDSGKLPGTLTVRVNPTSLPAATYSTTAVTVTVGGVVTTIPVTLVVSPAPATLTPSVTTLNFSAPPFPPLSQIVTLSTNGAPISFTASSGAPWLTVATRLGGASDIVFQGEQYPLTVSVDPSSLAPQTAPYVGKITIATSGSATTPKSLNLTVNLTVSSLTPTITSVWPPTLPVNGPAQTITIQGTNFYASTVAKVKGVAAPLATTIFKDSSKVLQAVIPASLLTAATTLKVLVSNPAPGGDSPTFDVAVANTPSISAIVNAASYLPGPAAAGDLGTVSPGELVTVFGSNIGPATPSSMSITAGVVDTTLGGVSVTVDGKPAPLIYVSQNQLSIQVPYEAALGAGKAVVVTNGTVGTANAKVTIAATAPGIFTADGSGVGPAAALNYNAATKQYSLNTSTNLAKIGDLVILYLSGEGMYDSAPLLGGASDTGFVVPLTAPTLPQVSPAPTVKIGGQNADATDPRFYAGPIPGSIMGLLQINVVVPAGSTTGSAVPVTVTFGANTTQIGVTLGIHP
ncbi:MAG TPA: IPT/TIG domain-containing protein [Bryobacteraceae bacterium]|nr:IPT/TIG domain-containing protein [Bryobacteraceae bacterium]